LQAAANLGQLSLLRLVVGFVRTKYVALVFGVSGVGLLAQGNQLFLLGVTIGSAGLSSGVIRRLAELSGGSSAEATRARDELVGTSFVIHLVTSVAFTGVVVLLARPITGLVLGPAGTALLLIASVISVPLNALASGHLENVLFGLGRYDLYTRAAGVATAVGLPVFVVCAFVAGLNGAFLGAAIAGGLYFFTFLYEARRLLPVSTLLRLRFSRAAARGLAAFSAATVVTTTAGVLAMLAVRGLLLHFDGGRANGLYQVPVALTAYYAPFLTNALWGRLYPAVSARPAEAAPELQAALRLVTLGSTMFVIGVIVSGELLIRIAYSGAFLPAYDLLPIQLIGDLPFFALTTVTVYLLAMSRLRAYVFTWLGYYAAYTGAAAVLVPRHGAVGAAIAYSAAGWLVALVLAAVLLLPGAALNVGQLLRTIPTCSVAVGLVATAAVVRPQIPYRVAAAAIAVLLCALAFVRPTVRRESAVREVP
jgi:O-antigen/teichoic acid export membrane protein